MHCIHCIYGHSGVDRKDKLFYFLHVLFTCNVYISHISKHDQLSRRSGLDNMSLKRT